MMRRQKYRVCVKLQRKGDLSEGVPRTFVGDCSCMVICYLGNVHVRSNCMPHELHLTPPFSMKQKIYSAKSRSEKVEKEVNRGKQRILFTWPPRG